MEGGQVPELTKRNSPGLCSRSRAAEQIPRRAADALLGMTIVSNFRPFGSTRSFRFASRAVVGGGLLLEDHITGLRQGSRERLARDAGDERAEEPSEAEGNVAG